MSTSSLTIKESPLVSRRLTFANRMQAYLELTKPRILVMVLLTVAVSAFAAASGSPDLATLAHALVGIALVAGSGSALNQWFEQSTDAQMPRTSSRPIPSGRVSSNEVFLIGLISFAVGLIYLLTNVGQSTGIWSATTWVIYVWIYTPLKRHTEWNTAIGAVAGAMPIFMGWTVFGGNFDLPPWLLFSVVFLWQFPHFMAIAWMYREDYAQGGLKMVPVVDASGKRTGRHAILGALGVVALGLFPFGFETPTLYVVVAFLLGVTQLYFAYTFSRELSRPSARMLMRFSLVFLPATLANFAAAACL